MTEPQKMYQPEEQVAITLTRDQWQTVRHSLQNSLDTEKARIYWWLHCCNDKPLGAATVTRYKAHEAQLENVLQIIDAVLTPPVPAPEE